MYLRKSETPFTKSYHRTQIYADWHIRVLIRGFYCGENTLALNKGLKKSGLEQIYVMQDLTLNACREGLKRSEFEI